MAIAVDRDLLGESLHTAFRKGMDSTWSSLMWNAAYLVDDEYWGWFLDLLHHNFERSGVNEETIKYVFTEFGSFNVWKMHDKLGTEREYRDWQENGRKESDDFMTRINIFDCAVNMIGDIEVKALYNWFEYYHNVDEQEAS